jgi:magnesium-transporting ATPase (P-type)
MSHSRPSQAEKPSSQLQTIMKPSQTQSSGGSTAIEMETPLSQPAHTLPAEDIISILDSDVMRGLSESKVQSLQERWGPNQLKPPVRPSLWNIFLRQLGNAMTIVLMYVFVIFFNSTQYN